MTKLIFVDKSDAVFQPYHHRDWGPWKLDPIEYTIDYYHPNTPNCPFYSIDLDRCLTSAQVLDWIYQVARKGLANDVVAGMVRAIGDLLGPQANLCGFGQSKEMTRAEVRQLVDAWAEWDAKQTP